MVPLQHQLTPNSSCLLKEICIQGAIEVVSLPTRSGNSNLPRAIWTIEKSIVRAHRNLLVWKSITKWFPLSNSQVDGF